MDVSPIVGPQWLRKHRDDVVVVHVTTGAAPERVVAGAVVVDRDRDLAAAPTDAGGRHPLPEPEAFAASLGNAGIAADDTVVAYDNGDGSIAARLVWMLRALGQPAALLDGGLAHWPGETSPDASTRPPVEVAPRPWPADRIATIDEVASAVAEGVPVVDARSPERWRGEVEPLDPVAGRIPGSVNVPFTDNLDAEGRFRDPAALRALYEAVGCKQAPTRSPAAARASPPATTPSRSRLPASARRVSTSAPTASGAATRPARSPRDPADRETCAASCDLLAEAAGDRDRSQSGFMRSWSGWAAAAAVGLLLVLGLAPPAMAQPDIPAFPGAEGFGAIATGGRGGDVVIVDTLEPYGPGSFGEALDPEDCRPRIVVFAVSGVIEGEFDLTCGNVTIAGQTAPGAGITIRGRVDGYGADPGGNLIIRHIRVRSGPPRPDTENFHDAIQLSNNPVLILDHVTASWSVDETVDLFEGGGDITVQWSTIEQSRINPDEPHNYGLIVGPDVRNVSIHHNLFAHHRSRSPAIASGPAEVLNNVDYDVWDGFVHHNPADGEFHIVGNQYLNGPNAENLVPFWFDDEEPGETTYYLADNFVDDPSRDYSATVDYPWGEPYEGFEDIPGEEYATDSPSDFGVRFPVTVQPASEILDPVLAQAGAWPRDAVTVRTVQEVQDRSGEWDAQEPDDLMEGLTPTDAPADADRDGIADAWESEHGLDPSDGSDHATVLAGGYTAIEVYINELADNLVGITSAPVPAPVEADAPAEDSPAEDAAAEDAASAQDPAAPTPAPAPAAPAPATQATSDTGRALAFVAIGAVAALGGVLIGRGVRRR